MKYNILIKEGNKALNITKVGEKYLITFDDYKTIALSDDELKQIYKALNEDLPQLKR